MTDLASTDLTITVQSGTHRIHNKVREITVKIAFGDGALTYPTGGVPLPGFASFGMQRYLEDIILIDPDDSQGIMWKYDRENKKLRAFIPAIDVGAAGAATVDDFPFDTTDEPLATAVSISLTNNTGAGTKYLGRQKELVNTQAPAAQTMYAVARGW
jgi:hypothetical protein